MHQFAVQTLAIEGSRFLFEVPVRAALSVGQQVENGFGQHETVNFNAAAEQWQKLQVHSKRVHGECFTTLHPWGIRYTHIAKLNADIGEPGERDVTADCQITACLLLDEGCNLLPDRFLGHQECERSNSQNCQHEQCEDRSEDKPDPSCSAAERL